MNRDHERKPVDVAPYALRRDRPEDENLHELAGNLAAGYGENLVVLLGAGASVGATASDEKLPTAVELRDDLWRRFMLPPNADFDFGNLGAMTLDQAAAFAETKVGRAPVTEFVAARFRTERTLWQHAVLRYLNPNSLFTTNYDLLVEQAWHLQMPNNGVPPLVAIFSAQQRVVPNFIPLYKPHGSADRALDPVGSGGPVITTIDYFDMIADKQAMLNGWLAQAKNACVLMAGYSMTDMDIAARLYDIKKNNGGLHWYSVFPRTDSTVRKYWAERLRIRAIDRRFAEFMVDLDGLLNFIPPEWKYERIGERQQQQLIQ